MEDARERAAMITTLEGFLVALLKGGQRAKEAADASFELLRTQESRIRAMEPENAAWCERIEAEEEVGIKTFEQLFRNALEKLRQGNKQPMVDLFNLAQEVVDTEEPEDDAVDDRTAALIPTFLWLSEGQLGRWRRHLETFGILEKQAEKK